MREVDQVIKNDTNFGFGGCSLRSSESNRTRVVGALHATVVQTLP